MSDADIKAMLAFGRGSVAVSDVKSWCRKHEMKLQARDVGNDKRSQGGTGSGRGSGIHYLPEEEDFDEEELYAMEELLREVGPGDDGPTEAAEFDTFDNDEILEEHEAKEVLNTMIAQKKKTFLQSLQTKRAKAVARGYGQWRDKDKGKGSGKSSMSTSGYMKGGYYRMTLSEAKAKSRCTKCQQVGHWHRDPECPHNQPGFRNKTKEVNYVVEGPQSEEAIFCGVLDCETATKGPTPMDTPIDEQAATFECFSGQLRQDQLSSGGPMHSAKSGTGSDSTSVVYKDPLQNDVGCASLGCEGCKGGEYPVLWNETIRNNPGISYTPNEDLCATIDTGCQRMAIGLNTLKRLDQALPEGLQTSIVPQEHRFRSVHGTSTTKYVAAIPTSLGHRGSLLRPAVFETSASRDAPFLISLPFLMFCHSVLHLDPSFELRVEFRRFKFSAPCHIGPTGSLRVSLADFSSENIRRLQQAQVEFQGRETIKRWASPIPQTHPLRLAMESRGTTKRARVDEVETESEQVWKRMVLKLLFLVCRITDMAIRLLLPKEKNKIRPYSAWPLNEIPEEKGVSDVESLGSFSMVRTMDEEPSQTPPSPTPSYGSQITEGQNHATPEEIEMMGCPPICSHQIPCTLFMTRKQGYNFGRMFWRCPLPRAQQCRYFAWTQYQPNWKEPAGSSASIGTPVTPTSQRAPTTPERKKPAPKCTHYRTTRAGSNAYVIREKCEICGEILKNEARRDSETESNKSSKSSKGKANATKEKKTPEQKEMNKEDLAEYEEFQKFRQWQSYKKGQKHEGQSSSSKPRGDSPEWDLQRQES